MAELKQKYQATLNLGGPNRSVWCVIFRHPFRQDERGNPGRRVRRSLRTTDKGRAQKMTDELNQLLSDSKWWTPAMREQASRVFPSEVVAAFYDDLTPRVRDGWHLREVAIPLPPTDSDYARVLFLGTTGAGKTTLLRQLIGTGSKGERFPSTAPSRTTTCDIEVITNADSKFVIAVSFLPKDLVRQYVEECVTATAVSFLKQERPERTVQRFLEHNDQRFRLSYVLGTPDVEADEEEDEDEENSNIGNDFELADTVTPEDRVCFGAAIKSYLERISALRTAASQKLEDKLDFSLDSASQDDLDTFEELLEDSLRDEDGFHELVDDIMDDIENRFDLLADGQLRRGESEWPKCWVYRTGDRCAFIRRASRFASNQASQFGQLLAPLVDGIRVRGPFGPKAWAVNAPKLVLMDGEGLGHAVDAATSISTRVTSRYRIADVILLVDNALQPMLASTNSALQSIVTSGQQSKLVMAFTHFDQMRGPNLPNRKAKEQHVLAAVDQSIAAIGKETTRGIENALKQVASDRVVFLSNLQDQIPDPSGKLSQRRTVESLRRLLYTLEKLGTPPIPDSVTPVYDDANLVLSIHKAVVRFRKRWQVLLPNEHWSRVKALTRRLGHFGTNEYSTLRPVADLIGFLQVCMQPFLESPLRWDPAHGATDDMKRFAIDKIAQELSSQLHEWVEQRIMRDRIINWQGAYAHRGIGSARVRRHDIEFIYSEATPIPGGIADPTSNEFLRKIRMLIRDSVGHAGGRLEGLSNHNEGT